MIDKYQKIILRRCNELALRDRGHTGTNPNVGAIITDRSQKRILGEGWHHSFGGPHAEINAIQNTSVKHILAGESIAVSLEPCNHSGKTPACTKAIMDHEFAEVTIDQIDPNPRMRSKSLEMLRASGIAVSTPLDSPAGEYVIHPFKVNTLLKRPFIRLKMAISKDHFIGQKGKQVKISNAISDRWVHRLRNETEAIMAGTNTLLHDNPKLTSRYGNRYQPIRILPDRRGILPETLEVFADGGENIVLTSSDRTDYPAKILNIDPHDLQATFGALYQENIGSILIEGGTTLFDSIFRQHLWDELILIENTTLCLHTGIQAPEFPPLTPSHKLIFDSDTIQFINNLNCR